MRFEWVRAGLGCGLCAAALVAATQAGAAPRAAGAAASADRSDRSEARREADAATKALAARQWRSAAEGFESAYARLPNPHWLLQAARARVETGDLARAARAYARYLEDAPRKDKGRAAAERELARLVTRLGLLEVKAEGASSVTLDGEPLEPPGARVHVAPGVHLVEARFGDTLVARSATIAAGADAALVLAPPAPSREEEPRSSPPGPLAVVPPARAEERRRPLPPLVVYVGAGATALAGGLTIASGIDTWNQKDVFDQDASQENLDAGRSRQLRTNVLLGVTGVLGVATASAAVFLVDWSGRGGPRDGGVKVGVGPGSLVLRAAF